jgi:hypothetical protein
MENNIEEIARNMNKEILELIITNENDLYRHINKRNNLRNKINFCSQHEFKEEVRIANIELSAIDSIVYDYEHFIKDLKIILKSYENPELIK